ncbi:MAG: DUF262 domain-containing protein [Ardenticatenia bacterium]|nr:DUF262 domain-containing protein [Ardenticatenia bacterium]
MADLTIREILDLVPRGQIRIPAFQRGFVWDPDQVAYLMDSIYKGYPFGSLLLWRTREQLRHERKVGPFDLPVRDPDYPIDYVLDGQQRVTSIFGVFQSDIDPDPRIAWSDIYFDLGADAHAQESQFLSMQPEDVDPQRHFALKTLFVPVPYRRATLAFSDVDLIRLDEMQARFKEARIPFQLLATEDRARVAIVFARINRTGVPLDTLQLLSAWTWSEDFDLQREFEDLRDKLDRFGFAGVGEDSDLILRCCAAVLAGDASPATLVELRGSDVRARFQEITNGIMGAIDFLRSNLHIQSLATLPFATILVPLCVYFAIPADRHVRLTDVHRRRILRWFWRSCFARRFSSGVLRHLKEDIEGMNLLKQDRPNNLGDFATPVSQEFFTTNAFRVNSVNTTTFILMLAQQNPRSFVSGQPVAISEVLRTYNRSEFHHLFPRAYLTLHRVTPADQSQLVNFGFLSKADNTILGGAAPSEYLSHMPADVAPILAAALCPESLFSDDYELFRSERAVMLEHAAGELIA